MTAAAGVADRSLTRGPARGLFRDRPVVPLHGAPGRPGARIRSGSPGIVSASWAGVILRTAVPLAILAGCQTLDMLTGGIDLSVGAVASMAASSRRRS